MACVRLSDLSIGECGQIANVALNGSLKRRLLDLGCSCGCEVLAVLRSIGKDSTAFLIKGSLIALRKEVSDEIWVMKE